MPIPFILGGLALMAAGYGAKKGYDAHEKNEEAERIVRSAQRRFRQQEEELKKESEALNANLIEFAEFKLSIFTTKIKNLVELLNKCKDRATSKLNHEKAIFTPEEIKQLENAVSNSLEIASGLGKGITSGALTALGAYGGVGLLASASTGTAISALSGAAATNATLAWLGGGSLAVGGGGIALGTAVLGGIVAGPLVAVTGLVMNSKAEENLTEAKSYRKDTDVGIEKMKLSIEGFKVIDKRINELENIINGLATRFDNIYFSIISTRLLEKTNFCQSQELVQLMEIGKSLKIALEISLLDKNGNENKNFKQEIERIMV